MKEDAASTYPWSKSNHLLPSSFLKCQLFPSIFSSGVGSSMVLLCLAPARNAAQGPLPFLPTVKSSQANISCPGNLCGGLQFSPGSPWDGPLALCLLPAFGVPSLKLYIASTGRNSIKTSSLTSRWTLINSHQFWTERLRIAPLVFTAEILPRNEKTGVCFLWHKWDRIVL